MTYKTKEKRLAWQKHYYLTHPEQYEKLKAKMRLRKRIYEKYKKDVCEKCKGKIKLLVHHNNRHHDDNNPTNLITLCRSCHMREHSNDPENLFFNGKNDKKETIR